MTRTRILYITTGRTDLFDAHYASVLNRAARPGTEVVVRHLQAAPSLNGQPKIARTGRTYPPGIPLGQGEMFRLLWEAEADGFDAAIIGCSADPGLDMARRTLRMPVTAPLEAGLYLAAMLRQRVAVLIPAGFDEADLLYADLARLYGVDRRLAAVRLVDVSYPPDAELQDLMAISPDRARDAILESHRQSLHGEVARVARGVIRRTGAGTVYFGCTYWTGMLGPLAEELGVPALDPGVSALRMAEILADTVRTPSHNAISSRLETA